MILSDWTCPTHGVFEQLADRDADSVPCPECGADSHWTPTPVHGRVKRWEVVRGGWTKPERPTFYDTRELGEGMPLHEWREKRRAIRDEERKADVMRMARDE